MINLVLGPSLGTTAAACWGPTVDLLPDDIHPIAFELPGHGIDTSQMPDPMTIADIAAPVLDLVDGPFLFAGDSVGGQVGLQLLLDAPQRVLGAVLCCTGARIGDDAIWRDRIAQVHASGTASLVTASAQRWFGPGFMEREPERASALLHALRETSGDGYVAVCEAISTFDLRDRLAEIEAPVIAIAGAHDPVCPPSVLREIVDGVQNGRLVVLDDVAHQAPAERPDEVAQAIRQLAKETA